jgi:hypothetical protein
MDDTPRVHILFEIKNKNKYNIKLKPLVYINLLQN